MTRTLRAELLKLRTTPGPWVVMGVTLLLTALGIVTAFILGAGSGSGTTSTHFGAPTDVHQLRDLMGAGYLAATVMAPIVGILCITSEYRHKVITTTLLVTPRREQVLGAKVLASAIWGVLLCVSTLVLVAAMGIPLLVAEGGSVSALLDQAGPVIPGLFGAFALLAVFGVGVGTLVRNQVAGVILTVGLTVVLEPVLVALAHSLLHFELNWLPSAATAALAGGLNRNSNGRAVTELLSWWLGGLALLAWGLGTAALGYFITFRRDVT